MDKQPPKDTSALERTVQEQTQKIADLENLLRTELADIKQILSSLTHISTSGYYQSVYHNSQEKVNDPMQTADTHEAYYGTDKDNPPYIPEGTRLTCVRCNYQWTPHARRPKKCPECEAPWWFPPKWRWHQSQAQSQSQH